VTYIGMDVHKQETQVCIEEADGAVIREQRIRTTRERFTALLGGRPRARILLEAATESEWVAQHLETLGHEVIVADPNYAAAGGHHTVSSGDPEGAKCSVPRRLDGAESVGLAEPDARSGPRCGSSCAGCAIAGART